MSYSNIKVGNPEFNRGSNKLEVDILDQIRLGNLNTFESSTAFNNVLVNAGTTALSNIYNYKLNGDYKVHIQGILGNAETLTNQKIIIESSIDNKIFIETPQEYVFFQDSNNASVINEYINIPYQYFRIKYINNDTTSRSVIINVNINKKGL